MERPANYGLYRSPVRIDREPVCTRKGRDWSAIFVPRENSEICRAWVNAWVEKFETGTREAERRAELIRDLLISGRVNAAGDGGSD